MQNEMYKKAGLHFKLEKPSFKGKNSKQRRALLAEYQNRNFQFTGEQDKLHPDEIKFQDKMMEILKKKLEASAEKEKDKKKFYMEINKEKKKNKKNKNKKIDQVEEIIIINKTKIPKDSNNNLLLNENNNNLLNDIEKSKDLLPNLFNNNNDGLNKEEYIKNLYSSLFKLRKNKMKKVKKNKNKIINKNISIKALFIKFFINKNDKKLYLKYREAQNKFNKLNELNNNKIIKNINNKDISSSLSVDENEKTYFNLFKTIKNRITREQFATNKVNSLLKKGLLIKTPLSLFTNGKTSDINSKLL